MFTVLCIIEAIVCVLLIVAILLHSGKDSGFSGAFGVGGTGTKGSAVMEKNLTRFTAILMAIMIINAMIILRLN